MEETEQQKINKLKVILGRYDMELKYRVRTLKTGKKLYLFIYSQVECLTMCSHVSMLTKIIKRHFPAAYMTSCGKSDITFATT